MSNFSTTLWLVFAAATCKRRATARRNTETMSHLYLTLLHAAGAPRDKFGASDNGLRGIDQSGGINELLA